jgi:ABC-type transport system involved in multi-copper enzyme maturation permease subunit
VTTATSTPRSAGTPRRGLINCIRSELVRVTRPRLLLLGMGLAAAFGIMITAVVFGTAEETLSSAGGLSQSFATMTQLEASGGFFGSFELLARLLGLVVLAVWAISVATDYDSGFIRMLVQAEPNRLRLFLGKITALGCFTLLVALVATIATVVTALPAAGGSDISTDQWSSGVVGHALSGYANLTIAALAWGSIGLLIATITKNSGVAIGVGVGWLLLIEPIIGLASKSAANYLPGGTIGALAAGGTDKVSYITALIITLLYAAVAMGVAAKFFLSRDIHD